MRKVWIAVLSLAMAATFATSAAAKVPSVGNPCPPANATFTVIAANAALVADGFDCKNVDLVVTVSVTPTVETLAFTAKTVQINGPLTIDNTFNSSSDIFITAEGGGILISGATIRANDHLIIECKAALCPITIENSTIRTPINPLLLTGDTRAIGHGDVKITNSTFFGKQKVGVFSQAGKVTWICGGTGPGGCQDPLTSGVSAALCPATPANPTGFPCTPTFANADALRAVCFPGGSDVDCGGGDSECQVNAFTDVDLSGGTITCDSHFGVTSKTGSINLKDANITAKDALTFQAFRKIDATNADLTSTNGTVTLESKGGDGPGIPCIIITGAVISSPNQIKANNGCLIVN